MAQALVSRARLLAPALLLAAGVAAAANPRLVNENVYSEDSEDARQHAHYLGYIFAPAFTAADDRSGLWLGVWDFDDPAGAVDFRALRFTHDTPLGADSRLQLRLTQLDGEDWSPLLGSISLAHTARERWRFEASAERALIDSVPAIARRLYGDTYTAGADYAINTEWTLAGALQHQRIRDGNEREGGVLRLIYSPAALPGFTVQTRSRLMDSDFDGAGYFSPPELAEHLLLLGYARALGENERWLLSGLAGPGRQRFEDAAGESTRNSLFHAELKLRGWFSDRFGLEGRAFCSNAGGPNRGAPDDDYRYCYATASLLVSW